MLNKKNSKWHFFIANLLLCSCVCINLLVAQEKQPDLKNQFAALPKPVALAAALSANLTQLNGQTHLYLNPAAVDFAEAETSKEILEDSWSITSYEELIAQIEDLEQWGHAGSYNKLLGYITANPTLSISGIIKKECLTVLEGRRLFFVQNMKDALGIHGLEAWDKGREINLLRWGVAAGYISEQEAMERIAPIAKRLQQDYCSWEDFTAHYIAGRQFFALTRGNYERMANDALNAARICKNQYGMDAIPFTGKESAQHKKLSLEQALYQPAAEDLEWDTIQSVSSAETITNQQATQLESFIVKYPDTACLLYLKSLVFNQKQLHSQAFVVIQQAENLLKNCSYDKELYEEVYSFYTFQALIAQQPEKALYGISRMSPTQQEQAWELYLCGMANIQLVGSSPNEKLNEQYAQKAYSSFLNAKVAGYPLPESIEQWLKQVEESGD